LEIVNNAELFDEIIAFHFFLNVLFGGGDPLSFILFHEDVDDGGISLGIEFQIVSKFVVLLFELLHIDKHLPAAAAFHCVRL